ncbi:uncharacterized protein LOC133528496 [Cydia pomonella]|uniref:uncharacterized protein LOC133528496 n=1 Tax=Cydia pomonella TaxID=82600 RepID=UPI002ADE2B31|nr:uncharacterized protein LOC133528496 [Cydia pomonella]
MNFIPQKGVHKETSPLLWTLAVINLSLITLCIRRCALYYLIRVKMVHRIIVLLVLVAITWQINFDKTIIAVHFPHYKILLSLGDCKNRVLYSEQQIWPTVKLNRVLDIYYKSNDSSLVSRVEIHLIVNNTEFIALAYNDVGSREFSANILLPIHSCATFYNLNIFTCTPSKQKHKDVSNEELDTLEDIESLSKMPFYVKKKPEALPRKTKI